MGGSPARQTSCSMKQPLFSATGVLQERAVVV